jgi:hypothetical protein
MHFHQEGLILLILHSILIQHVIKIAVHAVLIYNEESRELNPPDGNA